MTRVTDVGLPSWADALVAEAGSCGERIEAALSVAGRLGTDLPVAGEGGTQLRWAVLAALARANVMVSRVVEAHTDALTILHEAGADVPTDGTWGVFAAESPASRLQAEATEADRHTLTGHKPWCSLGDVLSDALVTAWDGSRRRLFAVGLRRPGVSPHPADGWVSRGLPTVTSVGIDFDHVPAVPVGAPGWYLERPGFAWGGIGVAACWFGAARGLVDALRRGRADDLGALHLGRADVALFTADCALGAAARAVDEGRAGGQDGAVWALRARAVVAEACEVILTQAAHALGPAPLAFDEAHAARVADLQIYLRQHHAERDLAALGAMLRGDA